MESVIAIRRDGAGFVVGIEPPDPAYPPERFETFKRANGAAGGLRLVLGLRKVDLTDQ